MGDEKEIEKKVNLEGFAASVELPEGHQLVIGELPPGTVVEVATWQGTGRPDDTTNRFLLSASGSGLQRRTRNFEGLTTPPAIERTEQREITSSAKTNSISRGSAASESGYLGMRTFGVDGSHQTTQPGSPLKTFGRITFGVISVIAISSMALSLLGFSVVVPERGARTAFGPSTASLVIFKKSPLVEIGTPTVAVIQVEGQERFLFGPSNSFDETTIQIETTAGQELVPASAVAGRAFLAIPGLGIPLKSVLG